MERCVFIFQNFRRSCIFPRKASLFQAMDSNGTLEEKTSLERFQTDLQWLKDAEYNEFLGDYLPVFVYLLVLCVIGTIGNIHVICIYHSKYKPSNHRVFILCLASVDLFCCLVSIPFEIFDIRYRYTFSESWCCSVFRTMNHIGGVGSGFLLCVIALERYRKACTPMKAQMTLRQAQIACVCTIVVSVAISLPVLYLYGSNYTDAGHPGIFGMDCTVLTERKNLFKIYSGLLLLATTTVFIICIIVYSFVGKVLYRQLKFRKNAQLGQKKRSLVLNESVISVNHTGSRRNLHKIGSQLSLDNISTDPNVIHDDESSFNNEHLKVNNPNLSQAVSHRKRPKFDRSKRITLMFLVATSISYLSYLPNMVISVIKALDRDTYDALVTNTGAFAFILLRLYFVSNVTNPVVYSFMDDRFRFECKRLYSNVKCKCKCGNKV